MRSRQGVHFISNQNFLWKGLVKELIRTGDTRNIERHEETAKAPIQIQNDIKSY